MLERIGIGTTIYEIVYDKEPYILEWTIDDLEREYDGVFIPYKLIGVTLITEDMLGSSIFFSYMEAEERLNYIVGSVNYG